MSDSVLTKRNFIRLPITIAVTSLLLTACNNTAPLKKTNQASPLPKSSSQTTAKTTPKPVRYDDVSKVPASDTGFSNELLDDESLDELANLLEATDMSMVEDSQLSIQHYGDLWNRVRSGFKIDHNQYANNRRIEAQKNWFITRQDYLNRLSARASRYLYHTVREAERRNIPTELALLPVIESSYDPTATSNASAAGLWQFIPTTGRIYGLNQSVTYDGRRDVIESTRAAYDFLTTLHNQFGSWELALAAYNAGPGRVQRAIDSNRAQGKPTDFWSLNLPTETRNYVPRFLAVAQIIQNPEQYGVYFPAIANRQHFRSVPANYGTSLHDVARLTGVSYDELRLLNPALISGLVDVSGPKRIVIPDEVNINVDDKIMALNAAGGTTIATPQANPGFKTSEGLAEFAQTARTPQQANTGYSASPEQIKNNLPTTSAQVTAYNTITQEPPLSTEERDFIARQIQRETRQQTNVINPNDGRINLSALPTQQAVLEAQGADKRISYDQTQKPKPQGARSVYVVQRGDTLTGIASRAGLNWREIAQWNQINPQETLKAGTTLYLYNAKNIGKSITPNSGRNTAGYQQPQPPQAQARADSYIVQRGDTLTGTASKFGLSVSELARFNGLPTNAELITGQKLWLIPGRAPTNNYASTPATKANAYSGATQSYTVQPGDSLIGLSNKFNISQDTLAAMNGLSSDALLLRGQKLNIPASVNVHASTGRQRQSTSAATSGDVSTYTVKSGDTLIGIANDLGVSRSDIAALNSFGENARLRRGSRIKVPASKTQVQRQLEKQPVSYRVRSGDTLIGVASRYGISVNELATANNMSSSAHLIAGRTISIPAEGQVSTASNTASTNTQRASSGRTETYTVKAGDSLNSVASQFGISIAELAEANNLKTTDYLFINQKIKVPATATNTSTSSSRPTATAASNSDFKSTETYTVKSGDTLIGLANSYGVSTSQLAQLNGISSNARLQRGQKLKVPKLTTTYRVKSGDSLIGLANRYGIDRHELAAMNGIAANAQLKIGQSLIVPNR